jgi:two-component system, NarL family, sensor histidine kinase DesK
MIAQVKAAFSGIGGEAPKRATTFAVAVMCVWLGERVAGARLSAAGQVPWVMALFALPLLYAFPGPRRVLNRYRWPVLAVQATLTWVPLVLIGASWAAGLGGLLAGLVLLTVRDRVAWLAAGLLLAADLTVRAAVTGLPWAPAWSGAVWVIVTFAVDALWLFGIVRLTEVVSQVDEASRQAADLAIVGERLQVAEALQAAVGERVAGIAARAATARQALSADAAQARAQIAAAGAAAREAVAQARAVSTRPARPGLSAPPATGAVIGARLAWAVLAGTLVGYFAEGLNNAVLFHDSTRVGAVMAAATVLTVALQLRHSWSVRPGHRPGALPVTLAQQTALV